MIVWLIALGAGVALTGMAVAVGLHDTKDTLHDVHRPGGDHQWAELAVAMKHYRKHKTRTKTRTQGRRRDQ